MLTRIVCPHCRHVGVTAACSQCGHVALIRSGKPASSPTIGVREEQDEPARPEA
jgi:DNA-directed RNA polymerase subunit RPC12/RpoP